MKRLTPESLPEAGRDSDEMTAETGAGRSVLAETSAVGFVTPPAANSTPAPLGTATGRPARTGGGPISKIKEMDGLRGLAILMVVNTHAGLLASSLGGMVGVTLFFVLSGFLITRLLLAEKKRFGSINLRAFYARRAIRLLPALLVYLVGFAVVAYWRRLDLPVLDMSWPPALYVANYVQIFGQDIFAHRHTWSLAVEEHFYLVWPVLVMLGATRRTRWLVVSICLLVAWRLVLGIGLHHQFWAYHGTDTNAYALAIGCLIAVLHSRGRIWRFPPKTAEFGVAVLILMSVWPIRAAEHMLPAFVWIPPIAAVVAGVTIYSAAQSGSYWLRARWLGWFGLISYSLYLWHSPLLRLPGIEPWSARALTVVASIVIATLSWILIEGPIMRSSWRKRFTQSYDVAVSG